MMEEIAKTLGQAALGAIVEAIKSGHDRRAALKAASGVIRRRDLVSDELWKELEDYVKETRDFEEHGAG